MTTSNELMNQIRTCGNIIKRTGLVGKDLPSGHGRIMSAIYKNDGATQSELAAVLEIRPQSLTRVLVQLEQQGLIERKRDQHNRRNIAVYVSEEGKKHHAKIVRERNRVSEQIFDCLNDDEKELLSNLLNKVIESNYRKQNGEK